MAVSSGSTTQLDDFRLIKKLGEGGMGTVYKARQLSMDRDVALKILPKHLAKDPSYVNRFRNEARASAKLDHPNIVRGIAVGEDHGFHYFAMELIDGEGCDKLLLEGKLSVGDAVKITLDVARALDHAHSKGMVHRDIKPENIMITRDGMVKLADLGLAKAMEVESGLTQTGSGFGTPYYMPPEQARNAKYVDNRSDIYALGATLYHLLTGQLPFTGETALEVLTAKEEVSHTPARRHNPEVPQILDLMLDKMLARDPKARYQSAMELIAALEKSGLANSTLSWTSAGASGTKSRKAAGLRDTTGPALSSPSTGTKSDPTFAPAGQYSLRYRDRSRKLVKVTGDKHQIRALITRGLLGTEVEAARDPKGPYRPLLAFPEFADLMKSRVLRERSDKVVGGTADRMAQLTEEEDRRRKMKRLKATLRRVLNVVLILLLLGLIAGGGYFGWTKYQQAQTADSKSKQSGSSEPHPTS